MMSRMYITTGRTVKTMTDGKKLDNPLPEPVKGRQKAPEFAVDCGETETGGAFDCLDRKTAPAGDPAASPQNSAEDDFDFPVADDDDFDLK